MLKVNKMLDIINGLIINFSHNRSHDDDSKDSGQGNNEDDDPCMEDM
jgi:hypothetical protein